MPVNAAGVNAAATQIRRYLLDHPNAADTLEGVAVCWLSGNTSEEYLLTVQYAVDMLMTAGDMSKKTLIDGTVIYSIARVARCT